MPDTNRSEKLTTLLWTVRCGAIAGFLAFPFVTGTLAEAASCQSLARQLAAGGGGGSAKLFAQVRQQRRHISTMRARLRASGCSSQNQSSGRNTGNSCRSNKLLLKRMERNLAKLTRKRGASRGRSKASLRRDMRRKGCYQKKRSAKASSKRSKRSNGKSSRSNRYANVSGTIRTYCVRKNDGLYVPVSFSTTSEFLERDQVACETRCPGTEMQLYYHSTWNGGPQTMVSAVSGEQYSELPNAFAFQNSASQAPKCNFASIKEPLPPLEIAGSGRKTLQQVAQLAVPTFRPTTNLLRGSVVPRQPKFAPTERWVRIVGESFFPVQ